MPKTMPRTDLVKRTEPSWKHPYSSGSAKADPLPAELSRQIIRAQKRAKVKKDRRAYAKMLMSNMVRGGSATMAGKHLDVLNN